MASALEKHAPRVLGYLLGSDALQDLERALEALARLEERGQIEPGRALETVEDIAREVYEGCLKRRRRIGAER